MHLNRFGGVHCKNYDSRALFSIGRADTRFTDRIECGGSPMAPEAMVRVRDGETGEFTKPGVLGEIEIKAPSRFLFYLHWRARGLSRG